VGEPEGRCAAGWLLLKDESGEEYPGRLCLRASPCKQGKRPSGAQASSSPVEWERATDQRV